MLLFGPVNELRTAVVKRCFYFHGIALEAMYL